ncbi:Protein DEHYDRATION-INDUCED 19 homolog 5 [Linum perenne]
MDVDFWSSRVDSTKHFSRHYHSDIHRGPNESEGDENDRACFPCPFCYVDIEIQVLWCHLQEEHCFNLKDAVCPLCAASLGKDVTAHFIVQHGNLLKRRRKPKKTMLLNSTNGRTKILESVPDPLLLPFISGRDLDSKRNREDNSLEKTSPAMDSESGEDDEAGREERRQRAAFVQELIASTIFD